MLKRSISIVVTCALLVQVCGCTSMKMIPLQTVDDQIIEGILTVTTFDGVSFMGDQPIAQIRSDTLYIFVEGQYRLVALSDIKTLYVKKAEPLRTALILIGIPIAALYIFVAIVGFWG
ncbi:hypothetical protein ACFL39_01715 [Gemmatimonadota bacterium]